MRDETRFPSIVPPRCSERRWVISVDVVIEARLVESRQVHLWKGPEFHSGRPAGLAIVRKAYSWKRDVEVSTFPNVPTLTSHRASLNQPEFASSWECFPLNTLESLKDLTKSGKLGKVGLF